MTKVATMGTSSCATIALQGFKAKGSALGSFDNKNENEKYLSGNRTIDPKDPCWDSIRDFMSEVIGPTRQDLGRTEDLPFDKIMDFFDSDVHPGKSFGGKFIITTLNNSQETEGYWPKRLKERGFVKIDMTSNDMGSVNHIYTRNNRRVES